MLKVIVFFIINIVYISLIIMGFYFKLKDLITLIKKNNYVPNDPNNTVNSLNNIEKSLFTIKNRKVNYKL